MQHPLRVETAEDSILLGVASGGDPLDPSVAEVVLRFQQRQHRALGDLDASALGDCASDLSNGPNGLVGAESPFYYFSN